MEYPTITLTGEGIQDTQELNISISVVATINVDAKTAHRRATDLSFQFQLVGALRGLSESEMTAD